MRHVANPPAPVSDPQQLSALRPLSAAESSHGGCSHPKKLLVRDPSTLTAISVSQTASQRVKYSHRLRATETHKAQQRFRWSASCWVGATGFEPVTSSVSETTGNRCASRRCCRSRRTVGLEVKCSHAVQLSALFTSLDSPRLCPVRLMRAASSKSYGLCLCRSMPYRWARKVQQVPVSWSPLGRSGTGGRGSRRSPRLHPDLRLRRTHLVGESSPWLGRWRGRT